MTYRIWTPGRLILVVSLALGAAAACGGSEMTTDAVAGAAGAGTGGTSTAAGGTGGTTTSTGGRVLTDGGNGGEGGTDSTPPPPVEGEVTICQLDVDCEALGQVCAGARRVCVDCAGDNDCSDGEVCVHNSCEERATCEDSLDCPTTDLVCVNDDGGPGPGPNVGLCLECASDPDCGDEESCRGNVCVHDCGSDKDCTPLGLLCDFDTGTCAECFGGARCDDGEYCSDGTCLTAVCTPDETACFGDDIATCNGFGSGYGDIEPCVQSTCAVVDGTATCVPD